MNVKQVGQENLCLGGSKAQEPPLKKAKATIPPGFCVRLNIMRALACFSVIITHILDHHQITGLFRSLHVSGHQGVYFFFTLSGYLISCSLVKEVRRRCFLDKKKYTTLPEQSKKDRTSNQEDLEGPQNHEAKNKQVSSHLAKLRTLDSIGEINLDKRLSEQHNKFQKNVIALFQGVKDSEFIAMMTKYLWNRTWRLFPMYYACLAIIKLCNVPYWLPEFTETRLTWQDALLLRSFPRHLWTMRQDFMFSYLMVPPFIVALFITFSLEKKGYKIISALCFAAIYIGSLVLSIVTMLTQPKAPEGWMLQYSFLNYVPVYSFGIFAGLTNYILGLILNKRRLQKNAQANLESNQNKNNEMQTLMDNSEISSSDAFMFKTFSKWIPKSSAICRPFKRIGSFMLSQLYKHKYNIVFTLLLVRIIILNSGVVQAVFAPTPSWLDVPTWNLANRNLYWYALFIVINDTRGEFWKMMHPDYTAPRTHASSLHRVLYHYGILSYTIYLIHPTVFMNFGRFCFKEPFLVTQVHVEFYVVSIILCGIFGSIVDYLVDKLFVSKFMLGVVFRSKKKSIGASN